MPTDYTQTVGTNLNIVPIDTLIQKQLDSDNSLMEKEGTKSPKTDYEALAAYILEEFKTNKEAKISSGIEEEILASARAFNGKYSGDDLAKIASEGGSDIFMNITATKSRTAKSWLSDIFIPSKGKAWSLEPSREETIPEEIKASIEQAINAEFSNLASSNQQGMTAEQTQQTILEINQTKRDVTLAIAEEVTKEAKFHLANMERQIEDQLNAGGFNTALLTFLEDICIFPSAFMKGPVICKKPKLYYEGGKPVAKDSYYFMNERVDPLDIYPSPDATSIQDGNLIEHIRISPMSLSNLKGVEGYSTDNINAILADEIYGDSWLDVGSVEQEKADLEVRGEASDVNDGIVHGLHYFGTVPLGTILEWNPSFKLKGKEKLQPYDLVEVEAIVAGTKVIKCNINGDPLKRRPYYKASYMNRPGSFWGRSLPLLMNDIQRMCNAAARALANNMALGSGPMAEVYTDRLADSGSISEMKPRMIFQVQTDPTGSGGRAIQFFQPALVAEQLLLVYEKFEQKADDVTGIPAWSYGNDKTATAPATVGGLSILLESTSKIIKDCVRNIDEGLIKPRVEYQFYWNLVYNRINFAGDVEVITRASNTLTTKSSEALRRQEFLQITANPIDQQVMGMEGRAEILRTMATELGLPGNAIPSKLEIKRQQKNAEANQQQQMQMAQQESERKAQTSLQATQIQVDGQKEMHQGTLAMQDKKLQTDTALRAKELELEAGSTVANNQINQAKVSTAQDANRVKEEANVREIALKLKSGEGI